MHTGSTGIFEEGSNKVNGFQPGVWDKESHIAGGESVPDGMGSDYHTAGGSPIALLPAAWQSQLSHTITGRLCSTDHPMELPRNQHHSCQN